MPGVFRVGVAQVRRFHGYVEGIDWLRGLVRGLSVDLIVLPENWVGTRVLSRVEFDEYVGLLREVSGEVGALIIGGSVYVDFGNKVVSVCPMVGGDGLVNYSEKIMPSRATGERGRVSNGERLGVVELGGWKVGCVICVDVMYPEITRALALNYVDIIANPGSISVDRVGLWRSLGLVRAFENSAYFVASLGTGYKYPDGRDVLGGSFIASPNGEYVLTVDLGVEGLFSAALNHQDLDYARARRGYLDDLASNYFRNVRVVVTKYK
ncbi:MAG: carbon-nitrogen hydrolase family protein [Vulcanisaeta sp.]|nr:carbon-nitrogen hydrolase family protein [Vulcanisaeta sp.]